MKRYIVADIVDTYEEDEDSRRRIARDPNTRASTLERMADDDSYFVQLDLASNLNTPVDVLWKLADHKYPSAIRATVAENPNSPVELLNTLMHDFPDGMIYRALARNSNTPSDCLASMAKLKYDVDLMSCIAGNPNTPINVLEELSEHDDLYVRTWVARNPSTPLDIVTKLANDPAWLVSNSANGRLQQQE